MEAVKIRNHTRLYSQHAPKLPRCHKRKKKTDGRERESRQCLATSNETAGKKSEQQQRQERAIHKRHQRSTNASIWFPQPLLNKLLHKLLNQPHPAVP